MGPTPSFAQRAIADADAASIALERIVPGLHPLPGSLADAVNADAILVKRALAGALFCDGHACGGMFVLERGSVRVAIGAASGGSLVVHRIGPGQMCAATLGCLNGRGCCPARCEAEGPVRGWLLPPALFHLLMRQSPPFLAFALWTFDLRLRGAMEVAHAVIFDRLERRLAAALLELAERASGPDLALTHQQLACELGCTREAASRVLESMAARGAVTLGRGQVHLLDRPAIARVADGSYESGR